MQSGNSFLAQLWGEETWAQTDQDWHLPRAAQLQANHGGSWALRGQGWSSFGAIF